MAKSKYYTSNEMNHLLDKRSEFQDKLYCRGITNRRELNLKEYPFYNNWSQTILAQGMGELVVLYAHHQVSGYRYEENGVVFFWGCHVYNPVSME